jgi:hypothetical protein
MATTPVPQEQNIQSAMSAPARLVGVLVNPKKTFEDIVRNPGWMLPFAVAMLISLVITWSIGYRIGWRTVVEKQIERSSRADSLTAAQKEDQADKGAKVAPIIAYVSVIVATPLVLLVTAGALLGVFNLLLGARVNFKAAFGIVTHAWMPQVILGLLAFLVMFIRPPDEIDIQNIVASNAGAFVGADAAKWMLSLASTIDIFSFWTIALLAIGFASANPKKVTFGKALLCVVGAWLFYVLFKTGMAAAFS